MLNGILNNASRPYPVHAFFHYHSANEILPLGILGIYMIDKTVML